MNTNSVTKKRITTKVLVYYALLIALSFIGAQIKIFQSIALDALPAFFAALFLGPVAGAVVGAVGHLLTAITSGFPMTVPIHLLIALCMAGICWVVGYLNGKINIGLNCIVGILLNGIGATYISVMAMQILGMIPSGNVLFMTLVGPLTLASTINVVVAAVVYQIVKDKIKL